MASRSFTEFGSLLGSVDQLIDIHGRLQKGRGRRHRQEALHRAGVVMTVAAWQAYLEKLVNEALESIADDLNNPPSGAVAPNWAMHTFKLHRAQINQDISKFNTPNSENSRRLLINSLNFDPRPVWDYRYGPRQWSPQNVCTRMNTWVKVRHAIAHGFDLPNDVSWLQDNHRNARLTLGLLRECRGLFNHVAMKTDNALSNFLVAEHNMSKPW